MISIHAPAKGATLLKCSSRSDGRDFNPRSREGSDHDKGRCEGNGDDFNPRSREGSDPATPPSWKIQRDFNPRSREGSDSTAPGCFFMGRMISIHAPAKGATRWARKSHRNRRFQSTLPRRERLPDGGSAGFVKIISIHAPAKGATIISLPSDPGYYISIHAPAKGATDFVDTDDDFNVDFNPRSREGSDALIIKGLPASLRHFNPRSREGSDNIAEKAENVTLISIHAPAKGATTRKAISQFLTVFQSTLPRRERQHLLQCRSFHVHFNPRSREGSDFAPFAISDGEA